MHTRCCAVKEYSFTVTMQFSAKTELSRGYYTLAHVKGHMPLTPLGWEAFRR